MTVFLEPLIVEKPSKVLGDCLYYEIVWRKRHCKSNFDICTELVDVQVTFQLGR